MFAIMSGRRAVDYAAVLRAALAVLPDGTPAVSNITADFEGGLWQALRSVFPTAQLNGCLFHFTQVGNALHLVEVQKLLIITNFEWQVKHFKIILFLNWLLLLLSLFHFYLFQSIYRKLQSLSLQNAYANDDGTRLICRRLMALALLPQEHIPAVFQNLEQIHRPANTPVPICELFAYVRQTWIEGRLFKPKDWSVFGLETRTNNDCEGWHNRLNQRGKRGKTI